MKVVFLMDCLLAGFLLTNGVDANFMQIKMLAEGKLKNSGGEIINHTDYEKQFLSEGTDARNEECYCGEHGVCSFEDGRKVCSCPDKYSERYGICTLCYCGINGNCSFQNGVKTCECQENYIDYHGACILCDCGQYGDCKYFSGSKFCVCQDGYKEKDGVCIECDCGKNGNCRFQNGEKTCECPENYHEIDGVCTACDCGPNGVCIFEGGYKKCFCDKGFSHSNGKCKECNCGEYSKMCYFNSFEAIECDCKDGYYDRNGICVEKETEACECGENSMSCFLDSYGNKVCHCFSGYADLYGICSDCACGNNSVGCVFDRYGNKTCYCVDGYTQREHACEATCDWDGDCENGRVCLQDGFRAFCDCPPNFKGEMCEIHELCENLDSLCRSKGAACVVRSSEAFCKCPHGMSMGPVSGLCEDICNPDKCMHGQCEDDGYGSYKCRCDSGYSGLRCEERIQEKPRSQGILLISIVVTSAVILVLLIGLCCLVCRNRK